MAWRLAKSLEQLRAQINFRYPTRDKTSDGSIGDASHSARKSDHNPNGAGVVCAIDIDKDLSSTETIKTIVDNLFVSRDKRIKYLIYNGRITERDKQGIIYKWIPYNGINKHEKHLHISVKTVLADNVDLWRI